MGFDTKKNSGPVQIYSNQDQGWGIHAAALKIAIDNLAQFASKNESVPIAHVANLSVQGEQLIASADTSNYQSFALVRDFVTTLFSSKSRARRIQRKEQVQEVVLRAIDFIKKNHLLIEQLKVGTPEEQKLAASALETINRYNAVLEKQDTAASDWNGTIARFFYRHSGLSVDESLKTNRIDLPRIQPIYTDPATKCSNKKINEAFQSLVSTPHVMDKVSEFSAVMLTKMMADPLSKKETDLLRMKASTLLRQNGVRFDSMSEALQAIQEATIHTTIDEATGIASLHLPLTLIPGVDISIQGAFQRHDQSSSHSVPLSHQFQFEFYSLHSGFPHPLQYTGWAFSNAMIPSYPHRLDQMPLFGPIYARKQGAMKGLHPDGAYFERARRLFKQKKLVFAAGRNKLLELHRKLNLAIIHAAPFNLVPEDSVQKVNNYFDQLESHPNPINYLARTQKAIIDHFIEGPHSLLQQLWLNRNVDEDAGSLAQRVRETLAENNKFILKMIDDGYAESQDINEKLALAYVKSMGGLFQAPVQSIILQHFSETFNVSPRMLNDFEQKLQSSAFKQLIFFLDEIEGRSDHDFDNPSTMLNRLIDSIELDIALFEADSCDAFDTLPVHITHELEVYFNSRYYSSL